MSHNVHTSSARRRAFSIRHIARSCSAACTLVLAAAGFGQASPGPYEYIPYSDGFITEAFTDLERNVSGVICDWTGWQGSAWVSPHAYNNHQGTDTAIQTGTPLYSPVNGTVSELVTNIPINTYGSAYGNYVKIQITGQSPNGENLDVVCMHMSPGSPLTLGQAVSVGTYLGLSDNTGNSTSEHLHFQSEVRGAGSGTCPFYWGHFKYPIVFNYSPSANKQFGHVIKIKSNTAIRTDRFDTSSQITTAYQDQLFYASHWLRGYYCVFIPNNTSYRSGWVKALDATEVFTGTVVQALPDNVTYSHTGTLASPLSIRQSANSGATELGRIVYGGGRFVADQVSSGWYRIPIGNSWGWVQANSRLVVYPTLVNPSVTLPNNELPQRDNFTVLGKSMFGRPKFNRCNVVSFSPSSPGGDGKAFFLTNSANGGDGDGTRIFCESVLVGKVDHADYYVEADMYFRYRGGSSGWERSGIFIRDDGFAGMDQTYEGKGNSYAITYDSDDGWVRAARFDDATITDMRSTPMHVTASGWHKLRIEARGSQLRFFVDGSSILDIVDTTFASGPCGMGYSDRFTGTPPADRGTYFDNFAADRFGGGTAEAKAWQQYR